MIRLLLALFLSSPLLAHIHGYTQLYNPTTNKTIDLLHDTHTKEFFLTTEQLQTLSLEEIKQKLYPTEKQLIKILEQINTPKANCIFICEASKTHSYGNNAFLDNIQRLLSTRLCSIPFICADEWRRTPRGMIGFLLNGISPLDLVNKKTIIKESGNTVWLAFNSMIDQATTDICTYTKSLNLTTEGKDLLIEHFSQHPLPGEQCLYQQHYVYNTVYWKLADIELLSYILSAPHKRILVYAGGIHSEAIARFLHKHSDYKITHRYQTWDYSDELTLSLLNPLEDKEVPLSAVIFHTIKNIVRVTFGGLISSLINVITWFFQSYSA